MEIEWKILKANADTERAQLNKILADIEDTITESAAATLTQANVTATLATKEQLNGFATAWRETTARVYEIDGSIVAIAQDVTALEARVDNVETGESGNASAISALTARVEVNEDGISATASDVTQLQNDVAGKASQTALNTLSQTVSDQGDDITGVQGALTALDQQIGNVSQQSFDSLSQTVSTQGDQVSANQTAITGINTTIDQQSASITEIAQIAASGVSGNAITNPGFEDNTGWGSNPDGTGGLHANHVFYGATAHKGSRSLRAVGAGTSMNTVLMPVTGGQQIRIGFWSRHHFGVPDNYVRLVYRGYNAAGQNISFNSAGSATTRAGGGSLNNAWVKTEALFTVPDDIVGIRLGVQTANSTEAWAIDDVFMEPVNDTEAEFLASYSVELDVNGYATGFESVNNGSTGSFNIRADKFQITSPGGGERLEWSGGNLRVYDSSGVLRVRMGVWT